MKTRDEKASGLPLHLAELEMTPPVIVVISIRAICMLCNDMTVGHYRSYGMRTAAMSWIMNDNVT